MNARLRLWLLTCETHKDLTKEDRKVFDALCAFFDVRVLVWNHVMKEPFDSSDVVLIRTVWDYHHQQELFLRFVSGVPCRCINPEPVIRWSSNKLYLFDLQAANVRIVPSVLVQCGTSPDILNKIARKHGWENGMVLKPVVGSLGENVIRIQSFSNLKPVANLLLKHDCIAQPFVSSIPHRGEVKQEVWSIMCYLIGISLGLLRLFRREIFTCGRKSASQKRF